MKPADGDAVVPANQRVDILALIDGPIADAGDPEAPALPFRNDRSDLFQRVPLEMDRDGRWSVRLTPEQIRSGLWYKLTAGPAATPEHRLTVRTQPFVSQFKVTYRYRPYRKARPETVTFPSATSHRPEIVGHRGTEIDLVIKANTAIAKGYVEIGKNIYATGEPRGGDPSLLGFRFSLEKSGTFRVLFETPGGEKNIDRDAYEMEVLEDDAPHVKLIEPGKNMAAPADGSLLLVGKAYDDFGVTGLTLKVRVPGQKDLVSQPYRPGKSFKFDDGSYPLAMEYYDTLHVGELKQPVGTELEYWLEATDNCDYPKANVGKSETYKLKLIAVDTDPQKQKTKNERAEMQANAGQKKQDDQHGQDNKDKNDKKDNDDGQGAGDKGSSPNLDQAQQQKNKNEMDKTRDKLASAMDKSGDNKKQENGSDQNPNPGDSKSNKDDPNKSPSENPKNNEKSNPKDGSKGDKSPESNGQKSPANSDSGKSEEKGKTPEAGKTPEQKSGASKEGSQDNGAPKSPMNDDGKASGNEKDTKSPQSNPGSSPKDGGKDGPDKKKGGDEDNGKKGTAGTKDKEAENGNKNAGAAPGSDPGGPKDKAAKDGGGDGKGTPQATNKKEGATTEKGPVDPDGKTEVAKTPPSDPKSAKEGDPKSNPGGPSVPSTNKDGKSDAASEKPPEPTRDEIDKLGEMLKQNSPEADKLAKELVDRGVDMKNADNKKALEDMLKEAGRDDDVSTLNREEKLPPPMNADGQAPMPKKDGTDPGIAKGVGNKESDKLPKGQSPAANTGGGLGYEEQLKRINPDEEFRKKLGSLQLDNIEDLKRRIPPDVLKKAGISDAEWQRFLKNAAEYQRFVDRNRPKAGPDEKTLSGGTSKIAGQGPRAVETLPGAPQSSEQGAAVSPPLEFQDAQRTFTRGRDR